MFCLLGKMAERTFPCVFLLFFISNGVCSSEVMRALWDDDVPLRKVLVGESASDEETNLIINRLSQVPFTAELKADAWYKLLKHRSAEKLALGEWQSDNLILNYFGQLKLGRIQLTLVAEAVTKSRGPKVLEDETLILKMGNVFCGFSAEALSAVNGPTLRSLLRASFFRRVHGCDLKQLRVLTEKLQEYTIVGPPRTWNPQTIKLAGPLLAGLNVNQLRMIDDKSFSCITPETIKLLPVSVLKNLRKTQLLVLDRPSLLAWRRKTRDMTPLHSGYVDTIPPAKIFLILILLYGEI